MQFYYLFQNHLVGFIEKVKFSIKPLLRAYDYARWLGLSQHNKQIRTNPLASIFILWKFKKVFVVLPVKTVSKDHLVKQVHVAHQVNQVKG